MPPGAGWGTAPLTPGRRDAILRAMLGGVSPTGSLSSVSWMLLAALATDLTILGSVEYATRAPAARGPGPDGPAGPVVAAPIDAPAAPPWAMCFVAQAPDQPVRAAITYLHPGRDRGVTAGEILGW